jgi:hypothetical protein
MTFNFPVIELFDRLAIAEIKWEKTQSNHEEVDWYQTQIMVYDMALIKESFEDLKDIHRHIWQLEADLRNGYEQSLGLEEIGRRAILIRDWNNKRIAIKNKLAEILNCPVREIKRDHLSQ